jgi:hypothetical protein
LTAPDIKNEVTEMRGFLPINANKEIILPTMNVGNHKLKSVVAGWSFVCEKCKVKKSIKMKGNGNICKSCVGDK